MATVAAIRRMDNPGRTRILQAMDTDLIIVGGGLNGPALALAAAQAGFAVTIIDSLPLDTRKRVDFDGRSYALAHAWRGLLRGIGVWSTISDKAQPMLEIKVTDGRAGEGPSPWMMHFDHAEIEEGPMGYMVEDRHLRRAFLDAMSANESITHLSNETVVAQHIEDSRATVTLASGKAVSGKVLIGSDGRKSGTAARAGIKRTGWGYGQTAVVCAVAHEKPHEGIAHQFFMPAGPLAILPLTKNRASIVWSETDARAAELIAMDDDTFLDALRPAFGSFLGEISLTGARFSYPLGLTLANNFVAERIRNKVYLRNYRFGGGEQTESILTVVYYITLPEDCPVYVKNYFGAANISNLTNRLRIFGEYSQIDIDNVKGLLDIRTRFGDIIGEKIDGNVTINARRSDVTLYEIAGNYQINAQYGILKLAPTAGLLGLDISAEKSEVFLYGDNADLFGYTLTAKIGRASCRERV